MPIGSSDAERGYSILKHTRYDRRSRLNEDSLDSILRIRINGPEIDKFSALHYSKLWAQEGNALTDSAVSTQPDTSTKKTRLEELEDVDLIPDESTGRFKNKRYFTDSNLF